MRSQLIISIALCMFTAGEAIAQKKLVDRRDQAEGWYVPVHGQVMANGKKAGNFQVILYRDNVEIGTMASKKKNGEFELELDIDMVYAFRIVKEGYQDKLIFIDTKIPKDLVLYPDYLCFVNLLPLDAQNIDPFYNDFPSAIVRYDAEQGGFYHNENYLAHIHTRLFGIAKAQ